MEVRLSPVEGDIVSISVYDHGIEKAKLLTLTGYEACRILVNEFAFNEVLDVGAATGQHSEIFRAAGKKVTTLDACFEADIVGDYVSTKLPQQYEAIWCSHVLSHQRNVGAFLDKIYDDLQDNGVLAITVPPVTSHWVSGGHCNWFNGGMLLYHLVMAGFDCRIARVLTYRYNVSVILRKIPNGLERSPRAPKLEEISQYLPRSVVRGSGMNGAILSYRTNHRLDPNPHPAACIDYPVGEIRYLIDSDRKEEALQILVESLQFNPLNTKLLELRAELER